MRKLLASDLDGTLVLGQKISDENLKGIKKLKENNHLLVVSTGRPYNGVDFLKKDYNISIDYFVLLNGALILDGDLKRVVHRKIEREIVEEILDKLQEGVIVSVETGYKTFVLNEGVELPYGNCFRVESLRDVKEEISLISLYLKEFSIEEIEEIKDEINENFGDKVIGYRNSKYIDVVPVGSSKGEGVLYVGESEKINKENIFTIGDSFNDISMFEITKNSYTFHNVEEGLKPYANNLVDSVFQCIEKMI